MEKEISSATMIAVVLIAIAIVISISFGIFSISKDSANAGASVIQDKIEVAESSEYMGYDQSIISGATVKQAISDFEGKNFAILIATQAFTDIDNRIYSTTQSVTNVESEKRFNAVYSDPDSQLDGSIYSNPGKAYENNSKLAEALVLASGCHGYEPKSDSTNCYIVTNSGGADLVAGFINYGALLADGGNNNGIYGDARVANIAFDGDSFRCSSGFEMNMENTVFNNSKANVNKSGTFEYVSDSARFNAFLIKDTSGTVMGIAFIQIRTN